MEGGRRKLQFWDKLSPDMLGLIFVKLSLLEILTVIPSVCKSWGEVVSGPYCWQEIDIIEWSCQHCFQSEHIDRMLQMLITRSCGSLLKLSVSSLSNDSMLSFVAEHASRLQILELPRSKISDSIFEQVAEKLSTVTSLDVSSCLNIGARAIEAIGKHSISLVRLRWVMKRRDVLAHKGFLPVDREAHAIATTMTKLKHLEIANPFLTTAGVVEILLSCRELELLDVSGCRNVMLDEEFLNFLKERCSSGLKVLLPDNTKNSNELDWDEDYLIFLELFYNLV